MEETEYEGASKGTANEYPESKSVPGHSAVASHYYLHTKFANIKNKNRFNSGII